MEITATKISPDLVSSFDTKLKGELEIRLNRPATHDEVINADKDSDLVNEVLWQLVADLDQRMKSVEALVGIK